MRSARNILTAVLFAALLSIEGCGGGGGGASTPSASPSTPTPSTNTAPGSNVQPISVEAGPANTVNLAFTSVTLCAPNSSNCQTIDHLIVDTGSTGLRIISSVLSASLVLQQQTDAAGNPLVECTHFADGFSWGPVKLADVRMAQEFAGSVPIQVIGDPGFPTVPSSCSGTGLAKNSVQAFGANGVLGVGVFRQDCGSPCVSSTNPGFYFVCPAQGCRSSVASLALQVQNPVSMFAADNNGVIIELPSLPPAGAASASGALVFGIGTQSNNGLGGATVLTLNASGNFTTIISPLTLSASFMDSGSNGLFFQNGSTPICNPGGFYCPPSTQSLSATMRGRNGATAAVNFSVANTQSLLANNPGFTAFNDLAAPAILPNSFDWGLPFFFGRNVFTAIEGANAGGVVGPYVAF